MPVIRPEPQVIDGLTCWIMPYYGENIHEKYATLGNAVNGWDVAIECGREFNNVFFTLYLPSARVYDPKIRISMPYSVELTDKEWYNLFQELEAYRVIAWLQDGDTYTIDKYVLAFTVDAETSYLTWDDGRGYAHLGSVEEFAITQHWIDNFLSLQQFIEGNAKDERNSRDE